MAKSNEAQLDLFSAIRPEISGLKVGKIEIKNNEIAAFLVGNCTFGTAMEATPECWGVALADALLGLAKDVDVAYDWMKQAVDILVARAQRQAVVAIPGEIVQSPEELTAEWTGSGLTETETDAIREHFTDGVNTPESADGVAVDLPSLNETEALSVEDTLFYSQAVEWVLKNGDVSKNKMCKDLHMGLNFVQKLIDRMELNGVISSADEKGRRVVLLGAVTMPDNLACDQAATVN